MCRVSAGKFSERVVSLSDLQSRVRAINDVLCACSLLVWDSRTMMPPGGAESRSLDRLSK